MEMRKLAISAQPHFGPSIAEQIPMFKKAGFSGFFTPWDKNLKEYRAAADEAKLKYIAVHAPITHTHKIWDEDLSEYFITYVEDTAKIGVPILIVHAYTVPEMQYSVVSRDMGRASNEGVERYRKMVEHAAKLGVKIAFENAEGEEQLHSVMRAFKDYENVGYCWDSGHEAAYAPDIDYLSLYGDKLLITHLNDNLGCRNEDGKISGLDDLHLLPFDGVINWQEKVETLKNCRLPEFLTFELKMNLPFSDKRHKQYENLTFEEYLSLAQIRARKIADMLEA